MKFNLYYGTKSGEWVVVHPDNKNIPTTQFIGSADGVSAGDAVANWIKSVNPDAMVISVYVSEYNYLGHKLAEVHFDLREV